MEYGKFLTQRERLRYCEGPRIYELTRIKAKQRIARCEKGEEKGDVVIPGKVGFLSFFLPSFLPSSLTIRVQSVRQTLSSSERSAPSHPILALAPQPSKGGHKRPRATPT